MISLLGYPLSDAVERLEAAGCQVDPLEARSKKGIERGEPRVVRQQQTDDTHVLLTYSIFSTELYHTEEQDAER